MSKWPMTPLGSILFKSEDWITPEPGEQYSEVTVRLWGKGVVLRGKVTGSEVAGSRRLRVRANQFILSRIDARNGATGLIPDTLDGAVVTNDFPVYSLNNEYVFPSFLSWMSKTAAFVELCKQASEGTTNRVRLKEDRFLATVIPLPPLSEQQRIVARIESLAISIEEACSLREQSAQGIERLKSSVISNLSGLRKWQVKTVGEIVGEDALSNGKSVKASGESAAVYCLVLSSMRNGRINVQDKKAIPLTLEQTRQFLVHKGDVFVMRGNGSKQLCGQAGLAEEDGERVIFPDLFIRVSLPESKILAEYFVAVWNSAAVRGIIEEKAKTTSGIWKVNQEHISSTPIPIPPLPEQRRIVAYLNGLQAKVDDLKKMQAETADELAALLPSILDKAFKGEL